MEVCYERYTQNDGSKEIMDDEPQSSSQVPLHNHTVQEEQSAHDWPIESLYPDPDDQLPSLPYYNAPMGEELTSNEQAPSVQVSGVGEEWMRRCMKMLLDEFVQTDQREIIAKKSAATIQSSTQASLRNKYNTKERDTMSDKSYKDRPGFGLREAAITEEELGLIRENYHLDGMKLQTYTRRAPHIKKETGRRRVRLTIPEWDTLRALRESHGERAPRPYLGSSMGPSDEIRMRASKHYEKLLKEKAERLLQEEAEKAQI